VTDAPVRSVENVRPLTGPSESLASGECRCDAVVWRGHAAADWRTRDYDVITIPTRGCYILEWAGCRVRVNEGEAAVLPAHIPRRARRPDGLQSVAISWFNLYCTARHGALTPFALYDTPTVLQGSVVTELLRLHQQVMAAPPRPPIEAALAACRRSLDVLDLVVPQLCPRVASQSARHDLAPLMEWLETRVSDPVSVKEMAAFCGLSTSRFHHVFRQETGETPHHYMCRKRLTRAAEWIRSTDLTVSEIAQRLSFADPFHLSRVFKAAYGMPPSVFRRSAQVDFF
jgi:AraC-like DNA-binding protein